jgi:uncharacterized membrane-anchored protein YjiN (DUF445 family)
MILQITAGAVMGVLAAMQQDPQTPVNITQILIAFLTGAFGSNGIAKIVDSIGNVVEIRKLRKELAEAEATTDKKVAEVKAEANERIKLLENMLHDQKHQHEVELSRILQALIRDVEDPSLRRSLKKIQRDNDLKPQEGSDDTKQ